MEQLDQARRFKATVASHTHAGSRKSINEDAIGYRVPDSDLLSTKGAVAVVADGVSSAEAGREAARRSVKAVLNDYYKTPELWSVKHAVQKTLTGINSELYELGREMPDESRGYICTLSMVVIKSHLAYLFHVGDSRIYRLSPRDNTFSQLTRDHVAAISDRKQYLIRAMGMDTTLKYIDPSYTIRSTRANSHDSAFCLILGHNAVHAGMAGRTNMVVGFWKREFTHVPISLAVSTRKQIDPSGRLWGNVLSCTGQPREM